MIAIPHMNEASLPASLCIEPAINVYAREVFRERLHLFAHIPQLQIDIADGDIASPQNFTDPLLVAQEHPSARVHIHAMVRDIPRVFSAWLPVQPFRITVHIEARSDMMGVLSFLKGAGIEAGIALGPATPLDFVRPFLSSVDFVLLVSVPPGKSGQPFDEHTYGRVRTLHEQYPTLPLGVDGGITIHHVEKLLRCGATSLSIGSGIFQSPNPLAAYGEFVNALNNARKNMVS